MYDRNIKRVKQQKLKIYDESWLDKIKEMSFEKKLFILKRHIKHTLLH